ncbi:ferritin [Saccharicrinis carchari]|uniref:Ferritin n=1 Tax=Saccharicrinis carchari TaxID=1168039 RepID=A0A521ET79_SACCC|nr:ferritin [Saccharicrinis carchari]SMO87114.1 ferritin [Saccharicrinis carchari]
MLKKTVEDSLVKQIEKEAYSSNLYLSMASWAETNGFEGVSKWMYAQAEEEKMHMLKFMKYVNERGGKAVIPAIKQPPTNYKNVQEVFEQTLEHERYVTASINEIVGVCLDEKDFTTHNWIQWFVNEQTEEEASVMAIIDKLKLLDGHNLYMFDRDIVGMRGDVPASQE